MPDGIRHPETLETLDSGFRRNDTFFEDRNLWTDTIYRILGINAGAF